MGKGREEVLGASVTSKGGKTLPLELWDEILRQAQNKEVLILVDIYLEWDTNYEKVLVFQQVKLNSKLGSLKDRKLEDTHQPTTHHQLPTCWRVRRPMAQPPSNEFTRR
ncbi:hypothetical protein IMZ48_36265 [Candidatus Bathyarchaeota archaeon]|nr:hypothetical protein [Candidatus Bathyarchaeota archaeon]